MKLKNFKLVTLLTLLTLTLGTFTSCSSDDDNGVNANINVNEGPSGDIGGDFGGNGGSAIRTISWTNNLTTADYNADITSTSSGTFQIEVADASGVVVLDQTLNGETPPDSIDGVTAAGTPGVWTVSIRLTSFNGDGSYSLSAGN